MEGVISNFRRAIHHVKSTHMIIVVPDIDSREKASHLVGKEVLWKSPAGKELKGKIASPHGNKGAVRAIFETGMPGQSIGEKVHIK